MIGIAGETVAGQFTVDLRTSSLRVFVLLQNKNTASFTHHKAVPIAIKWARGVLRFIVAGTHCAHGTETTDSEIVDHCLAAAGKKHLGFVVSDHSPSFTDRVTAGGTSSDDRIVGSFKPVFHRDEAARHVDDHHRNHEWRHTARSFIQEGYVLILERFETTDPASY